MSGPDGHTGWIRGGPGLDLRYLHSCFQHGPYPLCRLRASTLDPGGHRSCPAPAPVFTQGHHPLGLRSPSAKGTVMVPTSRQCCKGKTKRCWLELLTGRMQSANLVCRLMRARCWALASPRCCSRSTHGSGRRALPIYSAACPEPCQ